MTEDEAQAFNDAIKGSIDHSLQASFDETLSSIRDDQAAFQYHIDVSAARADAVANDAVHGALRGDLSGLTALESQRTTDGTVAPGVRMISSVFSASVTKESSFKVNLLGLVNVLSLSDLVRGNKVIVDPVSGDLTIADSVTGTQINTIVEPPKRQERIRKAMFESILVTAAYKASGAVEVSNLTSEGYHFALNQNTNAGVMTDYLNWLVALNLISPDDKQGILGRCHGQGHSTCLVRVAFRDAQCRAMFFDDQNNPRPLDYYLNHGRRAMMALLNDKIGPFDRYRYALLDQQWPKALDTGPSPQLAQVAGLSSMDPNYQLILSQLIGDVYDITWWASGMVDAGKQLQSMTIFLAGRDPVSLRNDPEFQTQRASLQGKMARVIGRSKARFTEPWGMVCLFWAAGSQGASAKLVTSTVSMQLVQGKEASAA